MVKALPRLWWQIPIMLCTRYGVLNINSSTGNFTFDASSTTSDYDQVQGLSANTVSFLNINLLDAGDSTTETFYYKLNDGTVSSNTGTITVNITGINDTPIAVDDQNTITEGGTITRSSTSSNTLVNNDTDVDGSDNNTNFAVYQQDQEALIEGLSGGTLDQTTNPHYTIRGDYGSLTIYYDGSYTYTADYKLQV